MIFDESIKSKGSVFATTIFGLRNQQILSLDELGNLYVTYNGFNNVKFEDILGGTHQIATKIKLGVVKIGSGLTVSEDGTVSIDLNDNPVIKLAFENITGSPNDNTALKTILDGKASLVNGKVPKEQITYEKEINICNDRNSFPELGFVNTLYIDKTTGRIYYWDVTYKPLLENQILQLGDTSTTAYRGDRGKIAYEYSQIGHVPMDDYTPEKIMELLLQIDTDDSGLNANTLQGKTADKFQLVDRRNVANGYAGLDTNGKILTSQLPDIQTSLIEGYYYDLDQLFYNDVDHTSVTIKLAKTLYLDKLTNSIYRWNGNNFIKLEGNNTVNSVNDKTGIVVLTKSDINLENVDNTTDMDKPISNAVLEALALKENNHVKLIFTYFV